MAELLFIATTIFVAYVLFEAVVKKTDKPETKQPEAKPLSSEEPATVTETVKTPPPAQASKPVTKTAAPKSAKATTAKKPAKASTKKATSSATTQAGSLKNPKTGEVAKVPGNYAFAKRWIKEALVEEGLLDKIYKNNELDADATTKIKAALEQLKAMDKYQ